MSIKIEKTENNNELKLEFTIEAKKFDDAIMKVFNKSARYFNIPGFRKGKAPFNIVERMYGDEIFYEDAFNELVPSIYEKEIEDNKLDVVSKPEINIVKMKKGEDLVFTAIVQTKPEVKLGKYKGVELKKVEYPVTDEDVEHEIAHMQEHNARIITVEDRPVKEKDIAVIDFEGFVDGKAFEGGKAEGHELEIGSNTFIPGFEDQIIGMKIDEERDIKVKFPEEYFAKDLAGKDAIFKVKVNEIKEKKLPKLDDEFASEVSDFETLDEYKEDIKSKAAEKKQKDAENEKENKLIEKVIENAKMDVADAQVADVQERIKDEFAQNLQYQGINLEQYMQICNITEEALMERIKPDAEKRIKSRLVLEAIAAAENIEVSDDEVHEELEAMAKQYQMNVEDIEGFMGDAEKDSIKKDLAVKKAVKVVVDNAKEV